MFMLMQCTAQSKKKQNKWNRLTYSTNFCQDHTRYPTSAQSYFQTSGGFLGSGLLGGWSGGRPGKNLVIRCCVVCIRCFVWGITLSLSGGLPGIRLTVCCWSVVCVGMLGSSVSCTGGWSVSRGWSAESCRLDVGKNYKWSFAIVRASACSPLQFGHVLAIVFSLMGDCEEVDRGCLNSGVCLPPGVGADLQSSVGSLRIRRNIEQTG